MTFQEKLKQLRLKKGLTQEELANKIFVSRTLISKYENGVAIPTKDNLDKLAIFFNVDSKQLLSENDETSIVIALEEKRQKKELILTIFIISLSALVAFYIFLPIFQASKYVYPIPDGQNQPTRIFYNFSIMNSCLANNNYICVISEIVIFIDIIILILSFIIANKKVSYVLKIIGFCAFIISLILMIFSFVYGISFPNSLDY